MKDVMVTIGIPVFQVENSIEQSLNSALSQIYEYIEYIVVDDCGYDKSMDIVQKMIEHYTPNKNIKIIHHSVNKGLGEARNTIIDNAHGDYIYFMDSDDLLYNNTISVLVNALSNDEDIIIGRYKTIKINNNETISSNISRSLSSNSEIADFLVKEHTIYPLTSWNKLYRRDFLVENNIRFANRYHEDYFFSLQELYYSNKIKFCNDITYCYKLRLNSITNGMSEENKKIYQRMLDVNKTICSFVNNKNIDRKWMDIINIKYLASINFSIIEALYKMINDSTLIKSQLAEFKYKNHSIKNKCLLYCIKRIKMFWILSFLPLTIQWIFIIGFFKFKKIKTKYLVDSH